MEPIFVNEPKITDKMVSYVTGAVKSGWISGSGPYLEKFEKQFAEYIGVKYATACSNGTVALQLALASLGIGKDDEVIIPDQTIISCALACIYLGANPIFVDVAKDTFCINTSLIEEKLTKKTKAIMPVHLFGQCTDMDRINALAKKYKLFVIEDAAEAIGGEYKDKKAGSMGDIGSFSLYSNKLITSGEGGVLTTNSKEIIERIESLKNLAHSKEKRFWHEEVGYNFRMTNYQAALGLGSLEDVELSLKQKQDMAGWYNEGLKDIKGLTLPKVASYNNVHSYWMYTIIVEDNFGITRDELIKKLWEDYKIQTRTFFYSLSEQPLIKKLGFVGEKDSCPVSKKLSQKGLYLPSGLTLTEEQAKRVVNAIKKLKS